MGRSVIVWLVAGSMVTGVALLAGARAWSRARREYVRLLLVPYRTDRATPDAAVAMFEALHATMLQRWWRRLLAGQASVAVEIHALPRRTAGTRRRSPSRARSLCARVSRRRSATALSEHRVPDAFPRAVGRPPFVLRLKKRRLFVTPDRRSPTRAARPTRRSTGVIRAMAATGSVRAAGRAHAGAGRDRALLRAGCYRARERKAVRCAGPGRTPPAAGPLRARRGRAARAASMCSTGRCSSPTSASSAPTARTCEAVAAAARAPGAENRLVERGTTIRQALLGLYDRRVARGEGNPLPYWQCGVYASTELPSLWQLPVDRPRRRAARPRRAAARAGRAGDRPAAGAARGCCATPTGR